MNRRKFMLSGLSIGFIGSLGCNTTNEITNDFYNSGESEFIFNPLIYNNVEAYYNLNVKGSVFIDSSGNVQQINDLSGFNRHLTQSNSLKRPAFNYSDPLYNGKSTIGPGSLGKGLVSSSFLIPQPMTIYYVGHTGQGSQETLYDSLTLTNRVASATDNGYADLYAGSNTIRTPQPASQMSWPNFRCDVVNGINTSCYVEDFTNPSIVGNAGINSANGITLLADCLLGTPNTGRCYSLVMFSALHDVSTRLSILNDLKKENTFIQSIKQIICHGNSLTRGFGIADSFDYPSQLLSSMGIGSNGWLCRNYGHDGWQTPTLISDYSVNVRPKYSSLRSKNILIMFEGGNRIYNGNSGGITGATAWNDYVTYCNLAKTDGFKIIIGNISPRGIDSGGAGGKFTPAMETARNDFNVLFDANWSSIADGRLDLTSGNFSNPLNNTNYQDDTIHYKQILDTEISNQAKSIILTL